MSDFGKITTSLYLNFLNAEIIITLLHYEDQRQSIQNALHKVGNLFPFNRFLWEGIRQWKYFHSKQHMIIIENLGLTDEHKGENIPIPHNLSVADKLSFLQVFV